MKRSDPLDMKRKRISDQENQPLLRHNRSNQRKRSFDAATEYFKKYKTPLTDTLQSLFGTQFFARASLWLDPLSGFRNAAGIIAYATRYRERLGFRVSGRSILSTVHRTYTNALADFPDPVTEVMTSDGTEVNEVLNPQNTIFTSRMWDSTRKSRTVDNSVFVEENFRLDTPQFGECLLEDYSSTTSGSPNVAFFRAEEKRFFYNDGHVSKLYERSVDQSTLLVDGSCTSFSGNLFLPSMVVIAEDLMNNNVLDMISRALPTKRLFNAFYNIFELRELPDIIRSVGALKAVVDKYVKNPHKLLEFDKEISNLYLTWQFGLKSTYDAFKDLMMLPERVADKMNYLIKRSNKATTGRSKKVIKDLTFDVELPTFEFFLPPGVEVQNESVERRVQVEFRCVINMTIQFPQLAVPSISDREYRRLVGLTPTAQDFYNIIPFTWLIDWFGGIGSYIRLMSELRSDQNLINYGFLTVVVTERLIHKAELGVTSTRFEYYLDEDGNSQTLADISEVRIFPYLREYKRVYQQRVDIGHLEGVKSFGFSLRNLSDFQTSILGALVTQRS